jgi:hypothetical protein
MTKWEFFKEIFENSGDQQITEYLYAHTDAALSIVLLNSPQLRERIKKFDTSNDGKHHIKHRV